MQKQIIADRKSIFKAFRSAQKLINRPAFRIEDLVSEHNRSCPGEPSMLLGPLKASLALHEVLMARLDMVFPYDPERRFSAAYAFDVCADKALQKIRYGDEPNTGLFDSHDLDFSRFYPGQIHHTLESLSDVLKTNSGWPIPVISREYFRFIRKHSKKVLEDDIYKENKDIAKDLDILIEGNFILSRENKTKSPQKLDWNCIAGYEHQKDIFRKIQRRAENIEQALEVTKDISVLLPNLILYGPPGTGKTHMVRVFASESSIPFKEISIATIGSSYYNGSALNIQKVFDETKQEMISGNTKTGIIYIDELTSIARRRWEGSKEDDKTVDALLSNTGRGNQLPGIMVIASTNSLKNISPTLLSRFDILRFAEPTAYDQEKLIRHYINALSKDGTFSELNIPSVVEKCIRKDGKRLVPRDIRKVIESSVRDIIDRRLEGDEYVMGTEGLSEKFTEYCNQTDISADKNYS